MGAHVEAIAGIDDPPFGFRDSQFSGGAILATEVGLAFTNCVLDRVYVEYDGASTSVQRIFLHNLVRGGTLWISLAGGCPVTAKNNLFDRTALYQSGTWTHGWNAYLTNQNQLSGANPANRILTDITYETGPGGWYYYPTNGGAGTLTDLVDAGSTNAHLLGFYHYVSATNGTKEAMSLADIGFRYVAVDPATGLPWDSDGDGLWDVWEDLDGDGTADSGETRWAPGSGDSDYDGDGVSDYLEVLLGRNPLVAGTTNDANGLLNLRVFTPLR